MSFDAESGQAPSNGGFQSVRQPRRLKPRQKTDLTAEEVGRRTKGKFLFSFGDPGSGKTTFQWMLLNYLMNEGPFDTKITIPERAEGHDFQGREMVNEWKTQWIEGRFPERTKSSDPIREIDIVTAATSGRKVSSKFSFLEVSGEVLRQVRPSNNTVDLDPLLRAYMANEDFQFVVVLMLNPDVEDNDTLFTSFMDFIDLYYKSMKDRMSLAIIITKPEQSLKRLQTYGSSDGRQGFSEMNSDAIEDYLNRFCPETYSKWDQWPAKKSLLGKLFIGEIEFDGEDQFLVEPNFDDIETIAFWIIEQFEGKAPGLRWHQKLAKWLAHE